MLLTNGECAHTDKKKKKNPHQCGDVYSLSPSSESSRFKKRWDIFVRLKVMLLEDKGS